MSCARASQEYTAFGIDLDKGCLAENIAADIHHSMLGPRLRASARTMTAGKAAYNQYATERDLVATSALQYMTQVRLNPLSSTSRETLMLYALVCSYGVLQRLKILLAYLYRSKDLANR